MNRKYLIIFFLVTLLAIPIGMVIRNEMILADSSKIYRFLIAPIDPVDPVRGRSITLYFTVGNSLKTEQEFFSGQEVYVSVSNDEKGFAYFSEISADLPEDGNYFSTTVDYAVDGLVYFEIPFDTYYLNETLAPKAEAEYNSMTQNGEEFYAEVSISTGNSLVRNVFYLGRPLIDVLRDQ